MIVDFTVRVLPDDTLEQTARDVRRWLDGAPDYGDAAGRQAVVAELERLEASIARGASSACGLALAAALIRWVSRTTPPPREDLATRH